MHLDPPWLPQSSLSPVALLCIVLSLLRNIKDIKLANQTLQDLLRFLLVN